MKRKIIKQANQAYTLTLPIDWIRKNKLSEKSEVDVTISEKALIVNSGGKVEGGKAKFDANNLNLNSIFRTLNALYSKGIDEIELYSKKDLSSELISFLNNTLGFALIEQKNDKYVIKDVRGGDYRDLDEIFKRVFQMILLFYESTIKDIFFDRKETLESLNKRDLEINKFCFYLQRAINKQSYPDSIKGRALFTFSFELEKISDEINRLWRTAIKYNVKKTDSIKKLVEASSEGLGKSFDFYYQFNQKNIEDIYKLRNNVRDKALALQNLDGNTARFVRHAVKIIEDATDLQHLTVMINL
ncbi:phosphate uptake regulator PhoU [Candidatus Pacearchaeota archaeon]|nr:phosphate uptake regulator PhoU [Candidatus Pacearchaeota archaeon]